MKHLLELFQYTFNELKDENERAIMEKYGNVSKRYTIILSGKTIHFFFYYNLAYIMNHLSALLYCPLVIAVCGATILSMIPFWPTILDIVSPANESRPHLPLGLTTEYFIDSEKYFFFILVHTNAAYCAGGFVMLATGTMNIAYFQLICGLFKVARWEN